MSTSLQLPTRRLVVRDFIPADWRMVYALSREPEVIRYQTWLRLPDEEAARRWVYDAIDHNRHTPRGAYNCAIVMRHDGHAIGWLGWGRASEPAKGDYNFGYALLPAMWGQGYMSEALRAALDFMFGTLGAQEVTGECALSNRGSARVMEKAGLHLVEQWDEHDAETGASEQHTRYAIGYADWASTTPRVLA